MALKSVYSEQFFDISHPGSPWIAIQLRTKINTTDDISTSSHWESITFNPSNFFNSMTLEDSGGAHMLTLELFDKNFANLETKLIKAITAVREANKLVKEPSPTGDKKYFEFFMSKNVATNLRIRFGYSEWGDSEDYIDAVDLSEDVWLNRINNEKPVIRSPWLYFQVSGLKFNLREDGLHASLTAFSVMSSFLSRAKMIQKYAKFVGHPKNILQEIKGFLTRAAQDASQKKNTVEFIYEDEPEGYPSTDPDFPDGAIEVMLGTEAARPKLDDDGTYRSKTLYKNVKSLLDEVCSKTKPRIYDQEGREIPETSGDPEALNENGEEIDNSFKYGYSIIEEGNKTTLLFSYSDPNAQYEKQGSIRVYPWLNHGQSLISNFDINTETDFANLNLPIMTLDEDGKPSIKVMRGNEVDTEDPESETDYSIGHVVDINYDEIFENVDATFVLDVDSTKDLEASNDTLTKEQASAHFSRAIIANINQSVFTGTITIPGDPFYLFDREIKPFSYLIKLVVQRPNYVDLNGDFQDGGVSYLSGTYVIKKITHTINTSGFVTNLEVMKWIKKKKD